MNIVLKPSKALAALIMVLYALPSLAVLFFPYGAWVFPIILVLGLVFGWETAKLQVLNGSAASIVCFVPPRSKGEAWLIVFKAGFTQEAQRVLLTPLAGCFWVRAAGHGCIISPDRVSPESWSVLHLLAKQQGKESYLPAQPSDWENLP